MDSQFYNAYSTPSEFCGYPTPAPAVVTSCGPVLGGTMRGTSCSGEDLVRIFYDNNGAAKFDVSPESGISSCAMGRAAMYPELLGFSEDSVATVAVSEYSHLGLNGLAGLNQNFGGGDSYIQLDNKGNNMRDQFGDQECCTGFMPSDSKPLIGQENWGFNKGHQVPTTEDHSTNMKVGIRYSEEERKERIERYLKKRNQRNFTKTIKYACRKTLADRRVRVRGRFAGNNSSTEQLISEDLTHQEMASNKIDTSCNLHACNDRPDQLFRSGGDVEIKYDEEDWLQEAMASLVYGVPTPAYVTASWLIEI